MDKYSKDVCNLHLKKPMIILFMIDDYSITILFGDVFSKLSVSWINSKLNRFEICTLNEDRKMAMIFIDALKLWVP